jgi:hypothetical protein
LIILLGAFFPKTDEGTMVGKPIATPATAAPLAAVFTKSLLLQEELSLLSIMKNWFTVLLMDGVAPQAMQGLFKFIKIFIDIAIDCKKK